MYVVKTLKKEKIKLSTLLDTQTCLPCMFALLYSQEILFTKEFETQRKALYALKYYHQFYLNKFGMTFCYSFLSSGYDLTDSINSISDFFEWLCIKGHLEIEPIEGTQTNIHYLNTATKSDKHTNADRIREVLKFFDFLARKYSSSRYSNVSPDKLKKRYQVINYQITNVRREFSRIQNGNDRCNPKAIFSSLSRDEKIAVEIIIRPSSKDNINPRNPFKNELSVQLRNQLIFKLMFNYGLRRSELLLLDTRSFVKGKRPDIKGNIRYTLVITSRNDDVIDPRATAPSMKTPYSHRIIFMAEADFLRLEAYVSRIRNLFFDDINDHGFIFTSLIKPYNPLSVSAVADIFKTLDSAFNQYFSHLKSVNPHLNIEKITPRITRHTWAFLTLEYLFSDAKKKAELLAQKTNTPIPSDKEMMELCVSDLQSLGGWSPSSQMPMHYARRFFSNIANEKNIQRIREDALKDLTNS